MKEEVKESFKEGIEQLQVLTDNGATKHGRFSWADKHNVSMEPDANYRSICAHAAKAYASPEQIDPEMGVHHYIAVAWRALCAYQRQVLGLDRPISLRELRSSCPNGPTKGQAAAIKSAIEEARSHRTSLERLEGLED